MTEKEKEKFGQSLAANDNLRRAQAASNVLVRAIVADSHPPVGPTAYVVERQPSRILSIFRSIIAKVRRGK